MHLSCLNIIRNQALLRFVSATKSPRRKPYFFPKHLRPQFAHALVIAHHFFVDFHFIRIAQAGVVLLLAVEAVGGAGLVGEGVADEAGVGGDVEQGDVAVVVEQLRQFVCIRQNQVLHDEFHVHHAAAGVFHIAVFGRVGGEHFFAHGDDFLGERGQVARLGEDFGADGVEGLADFFKTCDKAGTGERLVLPSPGAFALVFFKSGHRAGEKAGIAVGAQAQIDIVERTGTGSGGEPAGEAAGEAAVNIGGVGVWVFIHIHQIEVGGVAELFAAELAVADDADLGRIGVGFGGVGPHAGNGGGQNGVGQRGKLVR